MSSLTLRPCGDFRTSYKQDNTIFETKTIRRMAIITILVLCAAPLFLDGYLLTLVHPDLLPGDSGTGLKYFGWLHRSDIAGPRRLLRLWRICLGLAQYQFPDSGVSEHTTGWLFDHGGGHDVWLTGGAASKACIWR